MLMLAVLRLVKVFMLSLHDLRKDFTADQPFHSERKKSAKIPAGVCDYALVLT